MRKDWNATSAYHVARCCALYAKVLKDNKKSTFLNSVISLLTDFYPCCLLCMLVSA